MNENPLSQVTPVEHQEGTTSLEFFQSPEFLRELALAFYQRESNEPALHSLLEQIGEEVISIAETGDKVTIQTGATIYSIILPQTPEDKNFHKYPDTIDISYNVGRNIWILTMNYREESSSSEEHLIAFQDIFPEAKEKTRIVGYGANSHEALVGLEVELPPIILMDTLTPDQLHQLGEHHKNQLTQTIIAALEMKNSEEANKLIIDSLNKLAWEIEKLLDIFDREDQRASLKSHPINNIRDDKVEYGIYLGSGTAGERIFLRRVNQYDKSAKSGENWVLNFPNSAGYGASFRKAFQAMFEHHTELSKNVKGLPYLSQYLSIN